MPYGIVRKRSLLILDTFLWLCHTAKGFAFGIHEKLSFSTSYYAQAELAFVGLSLRGVAPAPHEKLNFSTSHCAQAELAYYRLLSPYGDSTLSR